MGGNSLFSGQAWRLKPSLSPRLGIRCLWPPTLFFLSPESIVIPHCRATIQRHIPRIDLTTPQDV